MPYLGVTPSTAAGADLDGKELILDADADTTITADTDDQIDIRIGGSDVVQLTANGLTTTGTVEPSGDTAAGDNAAIGYTSAEGLILTGQGSTNDVTIKRDDDTAVLEVATGQSDIEITGGNIFFGTADKGIYLGVTSATAANLLDDYEEGTFSPTVIFDGGSGTIAYSSQVGRYTKIGRTVFGQVDIQTSSISSRTGSMTFGGFPFTSVSSNAAGTIQVSNAQGLAITAGQYLVGSHLTGATTAYAWLWDATTGVSALQHSEWTDDGRIIGAFQYEASS